MLVQVEQPLKKKTNVEKIKKSHKNVCGSCIINFKSGKVLLVKQRYAQKWSFPKGSKKQRESKRNCMKRELFEETGVVLKNHEHRILFLDKRFQCTIFFIQLLDDETKIILNPVDKKEIEEASWFHFSDALALQKNRVTHDVINMIYNTCYIGPKSSDILVKEY